MLKNILVLVGNILGIWAGDWLTSLVPGYKHLSIEREIPFTTLLQCQLDCLQADGCIGISVNDSYCLLSHKELGFIKDGSSTALGAKPNLPNCKDRVPTGFTSVAKHTYLYAEAGFKTTNLLAQQHCRELGDGSHIFEPRSETIWNAFQDLKFVEDVWISIGNFKQNTCNNNSCNSMLEWRDGSRFEWQPWMTSNNLLYKVNTGDRCMRMTGNGNEFHDTICSDQHDFICQFVCLD